ncbi:MAG: hypothetical protein IKX65_12285, partial [Prevotella sp.]|nr:hypothetical protein [Prevotella sp.]
MLAFYLLSRDKTHHSDKFWSSEYKEMLAFYLLSRDKTHHSDKFWSSEYKEMLAFNTSEWIL